uniref:Putative bicarbonate transporter, ICT family n=1 Tax=Paulinella longichromatophora TaxID=1708747 RepID=A0A2H4ZPS4_9EUKA|nr:putative bicarbonate transporter, ICT family [Paulinella longichromatophora]
MYNISIKYIQGKLAFLESYQIVHHWSRLAGIILFSLMVGLPFITRSGLSLIMLQCNIIWFLWIFTTPIEDITPISSWLIRMVGVNFLATTFSPLPIIAFKGLTKVIAYLSIYNLTTKLLTESYLWWDRLVVGLLIGELITTINVLFQIHNGTPQFARWVDPQSICHGIIRAYGTFDNPNLLSGYLIPLLPISLITLLRWRGILLRCFAFISFSLGILSIVFTYSRAGWIGAIASLSSLILLLILHYKYKGSRPWQKLFSFMLIFSVSAVILMGLMKIDSLNIRFTSLLVGRIDSSNNFRINVWIASIKMIHNRFWYGIGPGNDIFNSVYPIYQQPKFNALSTYSILLEFLVAGGIPLFLVNLGLIYQSLRTGLQNLSGQSPWILPKIAAISGIIGLLVQGIADTIFFRPEIQISWYFCLSTLTCSTIYDKRNP